VVCSVNVSRYRYVQIHLRTLESSRKATEVPLVVEQSFENSLIIHEENTKKNHKRVVSSYVIEISLDLINFNFDFLDLHNVFFENYFANELTIDRSFLKYYLKHEQQCFITPKDTQLRLASLCLIKHCCMLMF
jgi:hypothetical protein